jgi:hypothetical protein
MQTLMKFTRYEIEFLLGGLAAVVAFQIITRRINTKGLLSDKASGAGNFSPARLQLLIFTLATAVYVLAQVMQSIAGGGQPHFPEINPNVLVVLGASHALFLGAKAVPQSGSKPEISNTVSKGD